MTRTNFLQKFYKFLTINRYFTMMDQPESGLAYINIEENCHPVDLFNIWLEESKEYGRFKSASFNLATASKDGDVSNRTLVLRDIKDGSFIFVTNGNSRKNKQIKENPIVSACFLWAYKKEAKSINRQVRLKGNVEQLRYEDTERYYQQEPLFCQIRSHICQQGQTVDWNELKKSHDELLKEIKQCNKQLRMPEHQVGYRIVPSSFDFYYSWDNNIADRLLFTKNCENVWTYDRIAA